MLDHTGFVVTNLDASRKFYDAVAKALGLQTVDNGEHGFLLGKGPEEYPYLWIGTLRPSYWKEGSHAGVNQSHVAFRARDEAMVRAFHKAAIEAGGTLVMSTGRCPLHTALQQSRLTADVSARHGAVALVQQPMEAGGGLCDDQAR